DSSIEPDEGAEDEEGTEWRSPPFKGDGGLDRLFRDVKLIRDMGYRANQSCGLHVHVDAIDFDEDDKLSLWKFAKHIEPDVFKFVARSRENNSYCKVLPSEP